VKCVLRISIVSAGPWTGMSKRLATRYTVATAAAPRNTWGLRTHDEPYGDGSTGRVTACVVGVRGACTPYTRHPTAMPEASAYGTL
jgi:hypothetical protein